MKKDFMGLRITEEKNEAVHVRAMNEGKTKSQIVDEALDIYLCFPPKFLKSIQKDADDLKRPVGIVVAYLFAAYSAMTSAMVNEDIKTPIFDYAFRTVDGKLMDLNEMGKRTFQEVQQKIRDLKKLAEQTERADKAKGKKRPVVDAPTKAIITYAQ